MKQAFIVQIRVVKNPRKRMPQTEEKVYIISLTDDYYKIISSSFFAGTKEERGLTAWQPKLMKESEKEKKEAKTTITEQQRIRMEKVCKQIYVLPYIGKFNKYVPWMKYLPFCPKGHGID